MDFRGDVNCQAQATCGNLAQKLAGYRMTKCTKPDQSSPGVIPVRSQAGCWDQSGLLRSAPQRGCKSKSGSAFIQLRRPGGSPSFKFLPTHDVLNFEVSLAIDVNCLATFCEDATMKANRLGTNFPWHSLYTHTLVIVPELCSLLMYYMKHILILRAMFWAMCMIDEG